MEGEQQVGGPVRRKRRRKLRGQEGVAETGSGLSGRESA